MSQVMRGFEGKYEMVAAMREHTLTAAGVLGDGGSSIGVKI